MSKNLKLLFSLLCFCFGLFNCSAQKTQKKGNVNSLKSSPKLVVGIVVDQMRYDYLTRFWNHYGEGGFKRLVNDGFNCKNNHFNYAPTSTGPGHASVYSGTTPASHGVIGNNWYDKVEDKEVYCASDSTYASVGTSTDAGKMSPHRMNVTTITDELRLHTQMRGKTIAIALKDRGAVLPGGHTANAAYWFYGGTEGNWITSSYYMNELPKWVNDFNASDKVERYKKEWNTYKSTFPHDLVKNWDANSGFDILKPTPFGNNITTDFAIEAVEKELLGADVNTDFLAISYSSTDYVGHLFGVNSKEVQDTYLRLDADLKRLFDTLDKRVGKEEYTVFLTADHGAVDVPTYLIDKKIPAGYIDYTAIKSKFNEFLRYNFGTTDVIKNMSNNQLFLDHKIIKNLDLKIDEAQNMIAREFLNYEGIDRVYTAEQMRNNNYDSGIPYILQNGYNQKRSGDILYVLKPGIISYISDIAPTLATLLGISFPNGTTGKPIPQVLD